jgi:hypothetical protein
MPTGCVQQLRAGSSSAGAFTSQGLTEDNEREIYKAQYALRALRQQLDKLNETAAPGQI